MADIKFQPLGEIHMPIFRSWLQKDHIRPIWQEPEDEAEFREKFLQELPARGVHPFIIELNSEPIGYIQYYSAYGLGGGWWESEPPGTFGIDLMIGDESKVSKGLGPQIIKEFISLIQSSVSGITSIIIDPDPKNLRAIRAFEKAGFKREAEIITPGGPALLMRLFI